MLMGSTLARMSLPVVWLGVACHSPADAVPASRVASRSSPKGASAAPAAGSVAPAAGVRSRPTLHEALCVSEVGCEVKPAFAAVPGQDGDARLVAIVRSQLTASPADAAQPTCQTDVIWLVRLAGDG